jgi:hypothetical protein
MRHSSTPRVAAHRCRSYCRTRCRKLLGRFFRFIHSSTLRSRVCIACFLDVVAFKNTCRQSQGRTIAGVDRIISQGVVEDQ